MKRRLLVTGGAGFIGANFVHYWLAQHPQDRQIGVGLDGVVNPVGMSRERPVQRPVLPPDRLRVVHEHGRPGNAGNLCRRHAVDQQRSVRGAGEPGVGEQLPPEGLLELHRRRGRAGQYAFAQTASATLGPSHQTQRSGAVGDLNSSSGSTRMVALVWSLIWASHAALPQ